MKVKMLIPAKYAVDMEVTKATGTKAHTVRQDIRIYAAKDCPEVSQTISSDGVLFLDDNDGHISAVTEDTFVSVTFDNEYDAKDFLEEMIEEREAK